MLPALRRTICALVALLALSACGTVRLEEPAAEVEAPTASEAMRQRTAQDAELLADLAEHVAGEETRPEVLQVVADLTAATQVHVDALGGVWVPTTGRMIAGPIPHGDADRLLAVMTELAARARTDALAAEGDVATLLASISVSRSLLSQRLAEAVGVPPEPLAAPEAPRSLDPDDAAELIRTLDALGHAEEVAAARGEGDARTQAAARARMWRSEAELAAQAAEVAGTDEDPREIAYDLDLADLPTTIANLRASLVPAWVAQIPGTAGDDRARVIAAATHAAEHADTTALPGLQ